MVVYSLSLSLLFHGVATFLSLSLIVAGCLSLSFLVPWSFCMSLTVSYRCWVSLTNVLSAIELLHLCHYLLCLLAVFHCLSGPMELLHFPHCLLRLLAACQGPSQLHTNSASLLLSTMFADYLSLSLFSHGDCTGLLLSL